VSIINLTRGTLLAPRAAIAETALARMIGLLGTDRPDSSRALFLTPCRGIHTFGMRYPIDAAFLDREGTVVRLFLNLSPNRMTPIVFSAYSVAEFAPHVLYENNIRVGDRLQVEKDESFRDYAFVLRRIFRWPLKFFPVYP
jgi:uncharacterized protein